MNKEFAEAVFLTCATALVAIFAGFTQVKGKSMEETLSDGDYLLLSTKAYLLKKPCRGDIVVVNSNLRDENGNEKKLIKRVIGLPGEAVGIVDGNVFIDGRLLHEDYLQEGMMTEGDLILTVPEDQLFLLGDNRAVSNDSRSKAIGTVDISDVHGKAVARLWPFEERKIF